jgi:phosphoserine phosphatase RsbU/P
MSHPEIPQKTSSPFELQPLVEFTRTINSSFDIDFILNNVLFTLMGKLRFTRGIILLLERDSVFRVAKVKGMRSVRENDTIEVDPEPKYPLTVDSADEGQFPWLAGLHAMGITHIYDLTVRGNLIGLAALGNRYGTAAFTPSEEIFLHSLINISATAIEKTAILEKLNETNRALDNRVQELNTLFEMSKEFGSTIEREQLVKVLVFSLLGHLGTNRYLIAVRADGRCEVIASRLPVREVTQTVLKDLMQCRKPIVVRDAIDSFDEDTQRCLKEYQIAVVVPMAVKGETQGIMLLGRRMTGAEYSIKDLEFLSSLGNLAMMSLENIRLFEAMLEKQRLEEELKIAREIQLGLLPKALPTIDRYQIAARMIPSKEVGGDYYDVVRLDDYRYLLAVADVSGKGTPAAMLMANIQATIRALAPLDITIAGATARVNELIYDNTAADKFITFFWAILDTENNTLKYVNAGHNMPFYLGSDGGVRRLDKGGMILGVMRSNVQYEHEIIDIRTGDSLIVFTDGISEAMNPAGEEFTEKRLEALVCDNRSRSAVDLLDTIVNSVRGFAGPATQSDDITALIVKAL